MTEEKKKTSKAERMADKTMKLREEFWPEVTDDELWHRKKSAGFITIPRALPWLFSIMDDLSSGKPVSATYFALWCRTFDQSVVTIPYPKELAIESGFNGERAETTWNARMKILKDLGFILTAAGPLGPFQNVLILNPYRVAKRYHARGKISPIKWNGLFQRAQQIGANDLERK